MAPKRKADEEREAPQWQGPAKKMRYQTLSSAQVNSSNPITTDPFGYPFEAMQVNDSTPDEMRTWAARWSARYELAQLSFQPEGI
ncbi:hypothetical protein Q7P37_010495 [Cladosporium fusiforme]